MRAFYADPAHHRRLLRVLEERLGHDLLARAEAAKIAVADGGTTGIDLDHVERGLGTDLDAEAMGDALDDDLDRIVASARETVEQAGLAPAQIDALYFTGGSTGLDLLTARLAAAFATAHAVRGDRFASVASGLGLEARRRFGAASMPRRSSKAALPSG